MTSSALLKAAEAAAERDDAIRHKGTEKVQGTDGGVWPRYFRCAKARLGSKENLVG